MDVYTPSLMPRYTRRPNCWTRSRIGVPKEEIGKICTIKDIALGVIGVSSHTPRPLEKEAPSSFWSIVESWGNTWMWDNLKITGDIGWIAEVIADNTLIAITNGSYMRELYPHLNSAPFVL